jgi:murein DD-endopeptidase MepM/ murein hydrolase activator NlpD
MRRATRQIETMWSHASARVARPVVSAPLLVLTLMAAMVLRPPAAAAQVTATGCPPPSAITWSPARPLPGTLFTIRVRGYGKTSMSGASSSATAGAAGTTTAAAALRPGGRVAGEPLHFTADSTGDSTGAWQALAAIPIDAQKSLGVRLACAGSSADSVSRTIPLAAASYPLEKLRVAPEFSAKPDSALAVRLRWEADRAAQVSTASHDTPRLWRAPFLAPRAGRITSRYGGGREFNGTVTSRHMGTDYAGAVGAPVRAANRGVVRIVDRFYLGGNVVYVDHGEGLVTAYLHLSQQGVAVGDTVERGATIGLVGATGRVTGPHLHWIARYGRVSVDPVSLLRVTLGEASSNASSPKSRKPSSKPTHLERRTRK